MIYFLIPALNEKDNLRTVIPSISEKTKEKHQFIIVDDGSSDGTYHLLQQFSEKHAINIIKHDTNQGVTNSFLHGFQLFLKKAGPKDVLITMEADSTSSVDILDPMIENLKNHDVVLASCYMKNGTVINTNLFRRLISFCANTLMRSTFPELKNIHTVSSFYRSFRFEILEKYWDFYKERQLTENSFACVIEMLIKLKRINARIIEIPMILNTENRIGPSKMPKLKTTFGYIKLIWRLKEKIY